MDAATLAATNGQGAAESVPGETRTLYCHGCGRRLFVYTPDLFSGRGQMSWRCRDCKTVTILRGADVPALLDWIARRERGD